MIILGLMLMVNKEAKTNNNKTMAAATIPKSKRPHRGNVHNWLFRHG